MRKLICKANLKIIYLHRFSERIAIIIIPHTQNYPQEKGRATIHSFVRKGLCPLQKVMYSLHFIPFINITFCLDIRPLRTHYEFH